jgi:hypothetical protein
MDSVINEILRFIVQTKILGIPLFFPIAFFIGFLILIYYLLSEEKKYGTSQYYNDKFNSLNRMLIFNAPSDGSQSPRWRVALSFVLSGFSICFRFLVKIGYVIWILLGGLLLLSVNLIYIHNIQVTGSLRYTLSNIFSSPIAMPTALGLLLMLSGAFLLLQFHIFLDKEKAIVDFFQNYRAHHFFLNMLFTATGTIVAIINSDQLSYYSFFPLYLINIFIYYGNSGIKALRILFLGFPFLIYLLPTIVFSQKENKFFGMAYVFLAVFIIQALPEVIRRIRKVQR